MPPLRDRPTSAFAKLRISDMIRQRCQAAKRGPTNPCVMRATQGANVDKHVMLPARRRTCGIALITFQSQAVSARLRDPLVASATTVTAECVGGALINTSVARLRSRAAGIGQRTPF